MRPTTKAATAGSIDGSGKGRGLFGGAFAICGASAGLKGSGARSGGRVRSLLTVLTLAILALTVAASDASAASPDMSAATISEVSYTSAHVTGTANTHSQSSFAFFEYSLDGVQWTTFQEYFLFQGEQSYELSADLTGLNGGTKYFVRFGGEADGDARAFSDTPEFTTLPVTKPTVLATNDASAVFSTSATVSGEVERPANPDAAFSVDCRFEYVTAAQFTSTGFTDAGHTSCHTNPITTPGVHEVSASLTGLSPATTYHLRLAGSNAGGVDSKEAASTFTTLAAVEQPPAVLSVGAVSEIAYATAKASGVVERPTGSDPALDGICRFEYVTEAEFQLRNEQQSLTIRASGGTYTLGFETQSTTPIAFDAAPGSVQTALEDLSSIGAGAVSVSGGPGDEAGTAPYTIDFTGPLAAKDVEALSIDTGALTGEGEVQTSVTGQPEGFNSPSKVSCIPNPVSTPGANAVTASLTGLAFGTTYHLRLAVSNFAGSDSREVVGGFTTSAAPKVQTLPATSASDSATLAARLNPLNDPVAYQFEWGTTDAYGNLAPAMPEVLSAGDNSFHVVTAPLTGLSPATGYHYRVVATNTRTGEISKGVDKSFTTRPAPEPLSEPCPNESSRVGPSADLPDCRVYEWVTPDVNNGQVYGVGILGRGALPDGSAVEYAPVEAPDNAESNESLGNDAIAIKGPQGWSSKSLNPPLPERVTTELSGAVAALSPDFTQSVVVSSQPLAGPGAPKGIDYYLRRADGTYVLLNRAVAGSSPTAAGCCLASQNFTHFFMTPLERQSPTDPAIPRNTYEWFNGNLRLVGILPGPGQVPLPGEVIIPQLRAQGASSISADGEDVLFLEGQMNSQQSIATPSGGPLYLRERGLRTVEVSTSQRTVDIDTNPPANPGAVGISADGSKVLFTSASELTDDANTGETQGAANDSGADLYSYDVQSEALTDLTVAKEPADAATGANVLKVVGVSRDASYVYFIATGVLAPGALSGEENLYVEHDGDIDFVASADGMINPANATLSFYATPDGLHAAFRSTAALTGYDNLNPSTNEADAEVFEYTYRGGLECASCRPSGEPPSAPSPANGDLAIPGAAITGRTLSDDGSRLFFQSNDQVLPQASNGPYHVYEYEDGHIRSLDPADGAVSTKLIDSSASGNDVFFIAYEELTPQGQGGASAIYDARVGALNPAATSPCLGESCRGAGTSPRPSPTAGSSTFGQSLRLALPGSKTVIGHKVQIRIVVPEGGELGISGRGLRPARKRASGPRSLTFEAVLTPDANKLRVKHRIFKTKAQVLFKAASGDTTRGEVSLSFKLQAGRGGK